MRFVAILVLASCAGGGARGPDVPAVAHDDLRATSNCDAGNWVPGSQEPAHYVTCTTDAECVKMRMPGCCSETFVAIRRDRACGIDLGSKCEMECGDEWTLRPEDGPQRRAACKSGTCALVR